MAAARYFIASVTVGSGGASSIDFSSIPSTYTDLCIKISARNTTANASTFVLATFNSSTSNFTGKVLYGTGSGTGSTANSGIYRFMGYGGAADQTSNTFSNGEVYIPNYTSANYKSYSVDSVTENNATAADAGLGAHLWSNTAAITSISLTTDSGTFAQYSTAVLYGIKNA